MFNIFQPKVPQVSVSVLKKSIDTKENSIIIDVRTPGELLRGKVRGCINIPVDEITKRVEKEIPDKSSKIFVYCLSGSRSVIAVSEMVKMGYTNIFDVKSGLLSWRIQKYPLV